MSMRWSGAPRLISVIHERRRRRRVTSACTAADAQAANHLLVAPVTAHGAAATAQATQPLRLPPRAGERALLLLLPKQEEHAYILGDMTEIYGQIAARHGARFARVWYYKQVVASAWPLLGKAMRLGLLTWVGAWMRRRV